MVYSHGAINHDDQRRSDALNIEHLGRLRALGGWIGLSEGVPYCHSAEALRAGIETTASAPFQRRRGYEGIGIGTDFLKLERTLPHLKACLG
jgi:membrane dipeptidase